MRTESTHSSAILKYYLYRLSDSVGFIWPVFTLFLLWNDLSYTQIGTLSAVSAVLVVVFELPTGYIADRIGRRNTLATGMAAMSLSLAGFVVADTFRAFVALYIVWSLSMALHHGTDDAWLYATLRTTADEEAFTRVKGRGGAVSQLGSAVTMIAGGFLYVAHPVYPFVASALLNACGVVVVLSMPRNSQFDGKTASTTRPRQSLRILRTQFLRPPLRSFVSFVALFFGVVAAADSYIQPIVVDVFAGLSVGGPASMTAMPEEATLGFVYAGFAVVAATASYHADTVGDWVGEHVALASVPTVVAGVLVFPALVPAAALPVFFVMKGGEALAKPLVGQYLNDRAAETERATVLSAASMSYAVVRAPLKPLAGVVADVSTPITAVAALGVTFVASAGLLFVITTPVESSADTTYQVPAED
ncbi:Predicted arabinose efflux permease, MFS family [Halovenus aranensis]|uniref:Predicted arabinose efflux permease, MFS family n=1 Tax=Halovenus aranensis TaxID=890420 RepID=A0A1G8UUX9_9EURY|nr:MFS transporter [Halovenus aranensis]SDJ57367.1 Predicted arabinose efflux permease, MFS family [Halovenus aranensis]